MGVLPDTVVNIDWTGNPVTCGETSCEMYLEARRKIKENTEWCESRVLAAGRELKECQDRLLKADADRYRIINQMQADFEAEIRQQTKALEKEQKARKAAEDDAREQSRLRKAAVRERDEKNREIKELKAQVDDMQSELDMYREFFNTVRTTVKNSLNAEEDSQPGNTDTAEETQPQETAEETQDPDNAEKIQPQDDTGETQSQDGTVETQSQENVDETADGKTVSEQLKELQGEIQDLSDKLHEKESQTKALERRLNLNSSNSSIPTSRDNFRGKVSNNRTPTGRPQGGQPGHDGHRRRDIEPTENFIMLEPSDEVANNPDVWYKTGNVTSKKMVGIIMQIVCKEYRAEEYRNRATGARYHAPFPANCHNELNYDESIKALIFYLKNQMKASEQNIEQFFDQITDGKLHISRGMINGINKQFAERTQEEQQQIFDRLKNSEILYTDFTTIRYNGRLKCVMVCTDKKDVWYGYREHKGEAAVKDSPYENFDGIGVHDHEAVLIKHAKRHQECLYHVLRYLQDAIENEPKLTWHIKMKKLIQEMLVTRKKQNRILTEDQIVNYENRYDRILKLGTREYRKHPPADYFRQGFNLHKRMHDKESHLRFLRDPRLDAGNNWSEFCLRFIKRQLAVSGTFRGKTQKSPDNFCKAHSIYRTMCNRGVNTLHNLGIIFSRPRTTARRKDDTAVQNGDNSNEKS